MIERGEQKPIRFEIILIIAAFLVAGVFTAVGSIVNLHPAISSSAGRIFVGVILLLLYRGVLRGGNPFRNLVITLPALLFVGWNLDRDFRSFACCRGRICSMAYIEK